MIDPWRDKPIKKRPENERKFSLKNPTDRTILIVILIAAAVILVILGVLLAVFLPDLLKKGA